MKGRDENGNYYIFHDVKEIFTIHAHTWSVPTSIITAESKSKWSVRMGCWAGGIRNGKAKPTEQRWGRLVIMSRVKVFPISISILWIPMVTVPSAAQPFVERRHATRTNIPSVRLWRNHSTAEDALIEEKFIKNTARFSNIEESSRVRKSASSLKKWKVLAIYLEKYYPSIRICSEMKRAEVEWKKNKNSLPAREMKKYASRLLADVRLFVCVCVCMSIPQFTHFLLPLPCHALCQRKTQCTFLPTFLLLDEENRINRGKSSESKKMKK